MSVRLPSLVGCLLACGAMLSACGGTSASVPRGAAQTPPHHRTSNAITHIVLMIQENRTFNNLFATFPGATSSTTGLEHIGHGPKSHDVPINLSEVNLDDKKDLNHLYASYQTAYRHGHMDAFNQIKFTQTGKNEGALPYQYVNPSQVAEYWTLATTYALADRMF